MIQVLMSLLTWARNLLPNITGWVLKLFSVGFIAQLLAGLGFGVVTYAAIDYGFGQLVALIQSNWSQLPSAVVQLATLSGAPEAISIILSAHASGLAVKSSTGVLKRLRFIGGA